MTPEHISLIIAGCAILGVLLHAIVYAHKEGKKEQRLQIVEDKIAKHEVSESALAVLANELKHFGSSLERVEKDTKERFEAIMRQLANRRTPAK
ncbi:hypothetical protein [Methylocaldum sp.]|uniref:hypothetical protein n=1 Tax=Methylocaldum sp. TaxID=1969727 RepID=UPI002D3FB774|nr:hypothetical protein [Methylocaldum sp.]HYE38237.1 hypothetical protein [Methylocaldum sp.]